MSQFFARDIIEAAKSDRGFDKVNAQVISDNHGIDVTYVLKEIQFVRKNLVERGYV